MASKISEKEVQLPYHLETMTTGTLPPEPALQTVACDEVKKEDKGKYCDSLVGTTFTPNVSILEAPGLVIPRKAKCHGYLINM